MPNTRTTIAHVLHRLDRAGAEVLAAALARDLRQRFEFVFLCLDGEGPLADELRGEGFVVEALGRQPGIDRAMARRLRVRLRDLNVRLIHAHQYTPFFYSALARGVMPGRGRLKGAIPGTLPGAIPGAGVLFTEHGRHYPDHRSTKRVLANKLLLKPRDRVTAVGGFVREALIKNEGINPKRIDIVYNGIDPNPAPAPGSLDTTQAKTQARAELQIEPDRPVVMQVARFHGVKDHATALRAWSVVHQQIPEALLVLVGGGDQQQAMQALAEELGIADAVRFTGPLNNARQLIPAADVCLLTSLSEGVSVTLLEAMAASKPVVATEVGGNPEVVEHNTTGLLAPRGDSDALAQHLAALLRDPGRSQQLGNAGRARLLDRFTAERMHAEYARLYDEMIGEPSE